MRALTIYQVTGDVLKAIQEDVGSGDITSHLLNASQQVVAHIITRDEMILCGQLWVNETLRLIDHTAVIKWQYHDGQKVAANSVLCHLYGKARSLLTAERTLLNFLQTLSATATTTAHYVSQLADLPVTLLDTRKTIPGLRYAQKYAVTCGGGRNHRLGLYDAFLIKENHIKACGSITKAINRARQLATEQLIEVEVTNLRELEEALTAAPQVIMLDNFTLPQMQQAVALRQNSAVKLEVSGGITLESIRQVALTGVDYISTGAITKHITAIDLTLLLI